MTETKDEALAARPVRKPAARRAPAKTRVKKPDTAVAKRHKPTYVAKSADVESLIADARDEAAASAIAAIKQRVRALPEQTSAQTQDTSPHKKTRGKSPSRRTAVERLDDPPPASGTALIERVSRAVERELSQIEVIVGGHHVKPHQRTEAERRARTLASLTRTLGEVMRLRAGEQRMKPADDDIPRDLDEFRERLSRRLDEMVRERAEVSAAGDERG